MNIAAVEFMGATCAVFRQGVGLLSPARLRMWDNQKIETIWDGSGPWSLR